MAEDLSTIITSAGGFRVGWRLWGLGGLGVSGGGENGMSIFFIFFNQCHVLYGKVYQWRSFNVAAEKEIIACKELIETLTTCTRTRITRPGEALAQPKRPGLPWPICMRGGFPCCF